MFDDGVVHRELHLFGVNHHQLQFLWMLLVEQRRNDGIQTNGFTLTCCTCHQEVRHLSQINHENFVGNGLAECNGKCVVALLEFLTFENTLHRNDLRFFIRYFNTNRSLSRHWSNDANANSCKGQSNVFFEVLNLRYTNTRCGSDFVKCNSGTYSCRNLSNFNSESAENLNNAIFIGMLLLHVNINIPCVMLFKERKWREFVTTEFSSWVNGREVLYFCSC